MLFEFFVLKPMMDTSSSSETSFFYRKIAVPLFTGERYEYWFVQMKTLFVSEDLWDIVQDGPQPLDPDKAPETKPIQFLPEARMKDAQALFLIHQGVSETIFPRIMVATTAKEAWETLKEEFRGSGKVIRNRLRVFWREYNLLRMEEGETVDDFFNRIIDIVSQIKLLGDHVDDKETVLKILRSLPPSFNSIVVIIEVTKDLSTLTVIELMWSLKLHEERLKRTAEEVPTKAYLPAVKSRDKGRVLLNANTSSEASNSYRQTVLPLFTGEKYAYWFVKMKTLFLSEGLWDIVQDGPQALDPDKAPDTKPDQFSLEAQRKNAQALLFIHQGISEIIFPLIMGSTTAKQAWETLKEEFRGSGKVLRTKLRVFCREYNMLRMKQGEAVDNFFIRIIDIVNQIKFLGDHVDDKEIVLKILRSLPPSFEPVVVAIEVTKDLSTLKVSELMWSLKFHEERLERMEEEVPTKAYQPAVKSRESEKMPFHPLEKQAPIHEKHTPHCIICNKSNHESKQCFLKCKRCKIPNHSDQDCWYKEQTKFF